MKQRPFSMTVLRIIALGLGTYLAVAVVVFIWQRSLLYFPAHDLPRSRLSPWRLGDQLIGYCHEQSEAAVVWLMLHGNAGQAADREYVLECLSDRDSLYVLEYPGYGTRGGTPCLQSLNQAASEAYRLLRQQHPHRPVCVLGESLGSGPACFLASEQIPPDGIVLAVPYDSLAHVAAKKFPLFPVRQLLLDNWDNIAALQNYTGPVTILAAMDDTIIPIEHARALAQAVPGTQLTILSGGHNDWSLSDQASISHPRATPTTSNSSPSPFALE